MSDTPSFRSGYDYDEAKQKVACLVWDTNALAWVKMTQPGGSGGGAATIADGADVAEGATTDAAVVSDASGTVSSKLRGLIKILTGTTAAAAAAPATAGVTNVDGIVVAANAARKGLTIVNIGAVNVFFGIGAAAARLPLRLAPIRKRRCKQKKSCSRR